MRLRKYMDLCYAEGADDARKGRPPSMIKNPGPVVFEPLIGSLTPYGRWAYDAGYSEGRRDLQRLVETIQRECPPPTCRNML